MGADGIFEGRWERKAKWKSVLVRNRRYSETSLIIITIGRGNGKDLNKGRIIDGKSGEVHRWLTSAHAWSRKCKQKYTGHPSTEKHHVVMKAAFRKFSGYDAAWYPGKRADISFWFFQNSKLSSRAASCKKIKSRNASGTLVCHLAINQASESGQVQICCFKARQSSCRLCDLVAVQPQFFCPLRLLVLYLWFEHHGFLTLCSL